MTLVVGLLRKGIGTIVDLSLWLVEGKVRLFEASTM